MQHAVDAKAHRALFAARLDVDITGALVEGVLEQPVDDVDDVRVVGIRLLIAGAEVEQLLEVAGAADLLIGGGGAADRLGQAVELDREALQVDRIGYDPLDRALEHVGEVGFPAFYERLAAGDGHGRVVHRHGKDLVALGEGVGHQRSDRGHVDLQRIDAQIGLPGLFGEPDRERLEVELLARARQVIELLRGDEFQRVLLSVRRAAPQGHALLGGILR